MSIQTQLNLQRQHRVSRIRKILLYMHRYEISLKELEEFEDEYAAIPPAEMLFRAKQSKPQPLPRAKSTNEKGWSID